MHARDIARIAVRASLTRLITFGTLLVPILVAACGGGGGGGGGPAY
jgi:hypothetical protein